MATTVPASISNYTTSDQTRNISWVQQAFLLTNETATNPDYDNTDAVQRLFTTASFCYSDTAPGGNWAMNPAPQFCRFADVTMGGSQEMVAQGFSSNRTTLLTDKSFGEGRYYNEIIEGNAQYVTMRFGVPGYNSLTAFFGNFYNVDLGTLTRTGRMTNTLQQALNTGGYLAGSLLALPFRPLVWMSQVVKSSQNIPSTAYAYFRPAMTIYWEAVNTMVNSITANLGLHERDISAAQAMMYHDPNGPTFTQGNNSNIEADIAKLHKYLPDIYTAWSSGGKAGQRGGIDVYALAARSQALAYAFNRKIQDALDASKDTADLRRNIQAAIGTASAPSRISVNSDSMTAAFKRYLGEEDNITADPNGGGGPMAEGIGLNSDQKTPPPPSQQPSTTGGTTASQTASPQAGSTPTDASQAAPADLSGGSSNASESANNTASTSLSAVISKFYAKFLDGLVSDLQDGSQFVTLKVDYAGAIGESFGNSFKPSDVEEKINSQVSSNRVAEYDMAGGHLVGGILGKTLGAVGESINSVVSGALQGMNMQGLIALAGAAYVDIPKMYDSSSTSMPSQSFTIHLRSPYGHKLALLQNLYIPLAILLAGCLPRATGPASYNSPFVCQLFSRGRMQVRYGMVSSLSVQRGTGNIGFTKEGLPLGIDVTFEVTDFSSMLYMPIIAAAGFLDKTTLLGGQAIGAAAGAIAGALGADTSAAQGASKGTDIAANLTVGMYSDDSIFSDYMAILGGLSFQDQIYAFRKWSIARDTMTLNFKMAESPYHWALMVNGSLPGQVISSLVRGTDRPS